jgi:hypothetical protein
MGQTIAENPWDDEQFKRQLKGPLEARLALVQWLIWELLVERFGAVPEGLLQRLKSATDLKRLWNAARQVWHIATPEDLQL